MNIMFNNNIHHNAREELEYHNVQGQNPKEAHHNVH